MKRALIVAAIAAALLPSPAGANDELRLFEEVYEETARRALTIFFELYREEGLRWRTEALMLACGEPVPSEIEDRHPERRRVLELHGELYGSDSDELWRTLAAVSTGTSGYILAFREATRVAFHAGLDRDVICGRVLDNLRETLPRR